MVAIRNLRSFNLCILYMGDLIVFIADVHQSWTIYVNNGNKYLIIGAVVSPEYSNT